MVEFGDYHLIDNYRIPWLIWIQFLVMFLLTLVILLSYFGFFALDDPSLNVPLISSSPSSPLDPLSVISQRRTQVCGGSDSFEDARTSTSSRAREVQNVPDREGPSSGPGPSKDLGAGSERCIHPCHYFDLFKQAFLQCLGLGSPSCKFRTRRRGHDD